MSRLTETLAIEKIKSKAFNFNCLSELETEVYKYILKHKGDPEYSIAGIEIELRKCSEIFNRLYRNLQLFNQFKEGHLTVPKELYMMVGETKL